MAFFGGISTLRTAAWHLRKGGVSQLKDHLGRQKGTENTNTGATQFESDLPAWHVPKVDARPPRHNLSVATILDTFSENAFKYEWEQIQLSANKWEKQLSLTTIDFLFVESAWNGADESWKFHLTNTPSDTLRQLISYCRAHSITTVFWNKEDPSHFDDFIETAKLFDFVYTTDEDQIPRYRQILRHDRISTLAFAAQQSIHNPIREANWSESSMRDVAFGGTYFRDKYPERRHQLDLLLDAAVQAVQKTGGELDIYSRFENIDQKYQFPSKYKQYIQTPLSYPQMLTAYRNHRVFLNVNSVVASTSMCARRIFEITACGAAVISSESPAIKKFFPTD